MNLQPLGISQRTRVEETFPIVLTIQKSVHFAQNIAPQAEKCMVHVQPEESNPNRFSEQLSPSVTLHYHTAQLPKLASTLFSLRFISSWSHLFKPSSNQ